MKKTYLILACVFILILVSITLIILKKDNKVTLEEIHYNTEERFISIDSKDVTELIETKKSFMNLFK